MKFGKELQASVYAPFAASYVEYDLLKSQIKKIAAVGVGGAGAAQPPTLAVLKQHPTFRGSTKSAADLTKELILTIEEEFGKAEGFVAGKLSELSTSFSVLNRRVAAAHEEDVEALSKEADNLSQLLVELERFCRLNVLALVKASKKADRVLGLSTRVWLDARLERASFNPPKLDGFLIALSDIWQRLRDLSEHAQAGEEGKVWQPPESFERVTTKYWVRLEDVLKLKTLVLKHLPVLVYGRESKFREVGVLDRAGLLSASTTDSGWITSIYLDSEDLQCYEARIRRVEGAQLFRLRWYGPQAQPESKQEVFIERKTHHESWTEEASVKERFSAKASKIPSFLDGSYDVAAAIDRKVGEGDLTAKVAEKLKVLALDTQAAILEKRLGALIRTRYKRAAYQRADNNAVRISLDTELQLFDETVGQREWAKNQFCSDARMMGLPGAVFNFPYAVLEVKLQDASNPPPWIGELLSAGLGTPVWKSSKYLTAAAYFFPGRIGGVYPHWLRELTSEEREKKRQELTQQYQLQQYQGGKLDLSSLKVPRFAVESVLGHREAAVTSLRLANLPVPQELETSREGEGDLNNEPIAAAKPLVASTRTGVSEALAGAGTGLVGVTRAGTQPSQPADLLRPSSFSKIMSQQPVPSPMASTAASGAPVGQTHNPAVEGSSAQAHDYDQRVVVHLKPFPQAGTPLAAPTIRGIAHSATTSVTTMPMLPSTPAPDSVTSGDEDRSSAGSGAVLGTPMMRGETGGDSLRIPLLVGEEHDDDSARAAPGRIVGIAERKRKELARLEMRSSALGSTGSRSTSSPAAFRTLLSSVAAKTGSFWRRSTVAAGAAPADASATEYAPLPGGSSLKAGANEDARLVSAPPGRSSLSATSRAAANAGGSSGSGGGRPTGGEQKNMTQTAPWSAHKDFVLDVTGARKLLGALRRKRSDGGDGNDGGGGGGGPGGGRAGGKMTKFQPVKIEPKTLWALERTYLRYLTLVLVLVALSTSLLSFQDRPSAVLTGKILAIFSLAFTGYACYRFFFRHWILEHGKTYGYFDPWGPMGLTLVLFSALIVNLVESFGQDAPNPLPTGAVPPSNLHSNKGFLSKDQLLLPLATLPLSIPSYLHVKALGEGGEGSLLATADFTLATVKPAEGGSWYTSLYTAPLPGLVGASFITTKESADRAELAFAAASFRGQNRLHLVGLPLLPTGEQKRLPTSAHVVASWDIDAFIERGVNITALAVVPPACTYGFGPAGNSNNENNREILISLTNGHVFAVTLTLPVPAPAGSASRQVQAGGLKPVALFRLSDLGVRSARGHVTSLSVLPPLDAASPSGSCRAVALQTDEGVLTSFRYPPGRDDQDRLSYSYRLPQGGRWLGVARLPEWKENRASDNPKLVMIRERSEGSEDSNTQAESMHLFDWPQ